MRKKDRLEKKRAKRRLKTVERVLRRMSRLDVVRAMGAVATEIVLAKLKQQSFASSIIKPAWRMTRPLEAAIVDDTGVVHWTTLVDKGVVLKAKEEWPRVTICDANRDLEQAACLMTQAMPTCVECIAREEA